MQIDVAELRTRFGFLWQRMGGSSSSGDMVWAVIEKAYNEPHRDYHNLEHVAEMLARLDELYDAHYFAGRGETKDAVEAAVWFHDIVYYTQAPTPGIDNEALSATWAEWCVTRAGEAPLRPLFLRVVPRLIRSTRIGHRPVDDLEEALHDLDYAVLGEVATGSSHAYDRYMQYEQGIREEWLHVPWRTYIDHRVTFLRSLLACDAIFRTDHYHTTLEADARANVERAIAVLETQRENA